MLPGHPLSRRRPRPLHWFPLLDSHLDGSRMVDVGMPVSRETEPPGSVREIAERDPPTSALPPSSKLSEQLARALPPSARTMGVLGLLLIAVGCVLYLARSVFIPL